MIYDINVLDINNNEVSLDKYKGKVLLVVNTATACGLTPQYEGLQNLFSKYSEKGLEILDFPCNQFFEQAKESDEEIATFCQANFNTGFKNFKKIEVNGENTHPLYKHLKEVKPESEEDENANGLYEKLAGMGFTTAGSDIKWNFTKFLVDREGNVVARFAPTTTPEQLEKAIEKLL